MNIFISHAVGPTDAPIVSRLRAVAAVNGISAQLPAREGAPSSPMYIVTTRSQLGQANAVLLIATVDGEDWIPWVNRELQLAGERGLPVVAMAENGVELAGIPTPSLVRFDRWNPYDTQAAIASAVAAVGEAATAEEGGSGDGAGKAIGALILAGLGFLALKALTDKKK